ncbi:MAG: hypothetical protein PHF18_00905 [Methanosarcina sp.]|nr:hypothetical protein [Methanosarcina sp.]MDD3245424.1 hypothetical protein [Methanosarcina sp.]
MLACARPLKPQNITSSHDADTDTYLQAHFQIKTIHPRKCRLLKKKSRN